MSCICSTFPAGTCTSFIMSRLQTTKFENFGRRAELHQKLQKLQTTKKRKFQKMSTCDLFFFKARSPIPESRPRFRPKFCSFGRFSGQNYKTTKISEISGRFPKFLAENLAEIPGSGCVAKKKKGHGSGFSGNLKNL